MVSRRTSFLYGTYLLLFALVGATAALTASLTAPLPLAIQVLSVVGATAAAAGGALWVVARWTVRPLQQLVHQFGASDGLSRSITDRQDIIGAVARAGDRALDTKEERRQALESALDAAITISSMDEVDQSLHHLLETAKSIAGAKYAALSVFGEDGAVEDFLTLGMSEAQKSRIGHLPRGRGLLGYIQESGETLRLEEMSDHHASVGFPAGHPPMHSLLATPIRSGDTTLGNLYLSDRVDGDEPFRQEEETIVEQLSQLAAVVVEGQRSRQANRRIQARLQTQTQQLSDKLRRLAEGDLSIEIAADDADDAMSALKRDLARTVENLRGLIEQVSEAANSTGSTSDRIQTLVNQLATSTEEQSAQADEVAAAVEEMTQTIHSTSQNTQRTADRAAASRNAAERGETVIGEAVNKVEEIADVVESSATTVEELGASSKEIGDIVETIDEIADQTNLLALNAAIEAARAGEQGKGFAVVAEEVRELAERTAEATDEIAEMIGDIQTKTTEAVKAMRDGTDEVEEGLRLADEAQGALNEIVESTVDAEDKVAEIASASEEQSVTSEQLSQSVTAISDVSTSSARDVAEIANHVDQLDRRAAALQDLVGTFDVGDGSSTSSHGPQPPSGDGWSEETALPASEGAKASHGADAPQGRTDASRADGASPSNSTSPTSGCPVNH
jgi:methyl-accepting chemotaxis protein